MFVHRADDFGSGWSELTREPCFRQSPVTFDRAKRAPQGERGLLLAHAPEKPHLDDAALPGIPGFERGQGVIERSVIDARSPGERYRIGHRDLLASGLPLARFARAGRVHQDAAHDAGCHGEKVSAVLPFDAPDFDQSQVRLVDQRGCLQRVIRPLAPHVTGRKTMELLMNERQELIQGGFVTPAPCLQQSRWIGGVPGNASILHGVNRFDGAFRLWL